MIPKILAIYILAIGLHAQDLTPNSIDAARKVADRFLSGAQAASMPEGKVIIKETTFRDLNLPVLLDQKTILDSVFDTDIQAVKGYRRLLSVKLSSKSGTELSMQYMLTLFFDSQCKVWKIWSFSSNTDAEAWVISARKWVDGIAPGGGPVNPAIASPAQVNYAGYGDSLVLVGKLTQAQEAYSKACMLNISDKSNDIFNKRPARQIEYERSLANIVYLIGKTK